ARLLSPGACPPPAEPVRAIPWPLFSRLAGGDRAINGLRTDNLCSVRAHSYGDILSGKSRRRVPEVPADPGLVVEDPVSGFCGAVVRLEPDSVEIGRAHVELQSRENLVC